MSGYTYKILLIYPQSEIAGVRDFVREFIDPAGADGWIVLALSATGESPATHGWCCFHATIPQANLWLTRFANRLGGSVPEGFTDLPRADQLAWVAGASAALWGTAGIYFDAVFEGNPNTATALATTGLQIVQVEI